MICLLLELVWVSPPFQKCGGNIIYWCHHVHYAELFWRKVITFTVLVILFHFGILVRMSLQKYLLSSVHLFFLWEFAHLSHEQWFTSHHVYLFPHNKCIPITMPKVPVTFNTITGALRPNTGLTPLPTLQQLGCTGKFVSDFLYCLSSIWFPLSWTMFHSILKCILTWELSPSLQNASSSQIKISKCF